MGRMYVAHFEEVAVTAIQDLFEINAPADAITRLHSIYAGQSSDSGDAEDEQLAWSIERATGSGSGGTVATAQPLEVGDAAFGGTVEVNNTTQATGRTVLHADDFNVRLGIQFRATPEERFTISPSGRVVVSLGKAPADSLTMSGSIYLEEIGG